MLFKSGMDVYLAVGATDLRKAVDGLALIIKESFNLDPFSKALFVFCNRSKNKLKILQWEDSGFWLHYKRLEHGRFNWPEDGSENISHIDERELNWLLDGLDYKKVDAHKKVKERTMV